MSQPYQPPTDAQGNVRYLFKDHNPYFDDIEILKAAKAARILLRKQARDDDAERQNADDSGQTFRNAVYKVVDRQRQNFSDWKPGEELNFRAQNAMHELREFRDRWGLGGTSRAGSRSNSRAPSRRASATDPVLKAGRESERALGASQLTTDYDAETTALTTQNGATPVDPSEAPSTPTMMGDGPLKSHTFPTPKAAGRDGVFDDDHEPKKPHVLFLDSKNVDGSGRLFDTEGQLAGGPASTAPVTTHQDAARPLTASPEMVQQSLPGESPIVSTPATRIEGLPDRSNDSPTDEILATPRNDDGAALPVTAQMPGEIKRVNADRMTLHPLSNDDEMMPRPSITSNHSELIPEGKGSKRMFKMSKMFSKPLLQ